MRRTFIKALSNLATNHPDIILLTGDLGYAVLEPFADAHPGQFINVGVAEQNMVGIATGMAEAGFTVFIYTIVPFAVLRPYEFIRNGPIAHQLPVRIVGTGGGVEYGFNGLSHFGLEDIGILRIQPGLKVICPLDNDQASNALLKTWNVPGPVYYRISKFAATIPALGGDFELGQFNVLRGGSDLVFVTIGHITQEVLHAADLLAERGVSCAVAAISNLPVEADQLAAFLADYQQIVTVEDHYVDGGIGSLVSEVVAGYGLKGRVTRHGIGPVAHKPLGTSTYLLAQHGLTGATLATSVGKLLRI